MDLDYRKSGVNIDAGNELIERIKPLVNQTRRAGVVGQLGGFGGAFKIPSNYKNPILISATDGVGTKLKLAVEYQQHDGIGIDLVAMCVNDLISCGAEPLFFLDYYATGKLDNQQAYAVINSICQGCRLAHCALIGGETAEMPGIYDEQHYDLAGFCVGVVEEDKLIQTHQVQPGDHIIGLRSNGIHANGYSLVRKIIERVEVNTVRIDDQPLNQVLMQPTAIYVREMMHLLKQVQVHGLAHITGGGMVENIPRVIPEGLIAEIDTQSWQRPSIFCWLQQQGEVSDAEMWRVFNQGIGMVAIVDAKDTEQSLDILKPHQATLIGKVKMDPTKDPEHAASDNGPSSRICLL